MSFLSDTRNFGILAMIAAAVSVFGASLAIADHDGIYDLVCGIGAVLGGLLLFAAGFAIFRCRIPSFIENLFPEGVYSKFGVLVGYTAAIGVSSILRLDDGIIWGAIILIVVWIITNDRKGVVEKILWVILAVVYFLGAVIEIGVACTGDAISIISGASLSLMYLLAFVYLFDPDVKKKFNI